MADLRKGRVRNRNWRVNKTLFLSTFLPWLSVNITLEICCPPAKAELEKEIATLSVFVQKKKISGLPNRIISNTFRIFVRNLGFLHSRSLGNKWEGEED